MRISASDGGQEVSVIIPSSQIKMASEQTPDWLLERVGGFQIWLEDAIQQAYRSGSVFDLPPDGGKPVKLVAVTSEHFDFTGNRIRPGH